MRLTGTRRLALLGATFALASGPLAGAAPASATGSATAALTMRDVFDVAPVDGTTQLNVSTGFEGQTGALLRTGDGWNWSWLDYASGDPVRVSLPGAASWSGIYTAGGDRIGLWDLTQNVLEIGTPMKNDWTRVALPSGWGLTGLAGSRVLVHQAGLASEILSYDGQGNITSTQPLQGLPTGATIDDIRAGDNAILLKYSTPDAVPHWGLADWATGTFHAAPGDAVKGQVTLDHDSFIDDEYIGGQQDVIKVYSVAQLLAGGAPSVVGTTAPFSIPVASPHVVGGHLYTYVYSGGTLFDLPLDGSAQRVAVTGAPYVWWGPDNTAVGRTSTQAGVTYSIDEYTAAADGSVSRSARYTPPIPASHVSQLWLNSGVLSYQRDWQSQPTTVSVAAGSDAVSGPADMTLGWGWPADGSGLPVGTVVQRDARGTQLRTVDTHGACSPNTIQATSRWLYWSCGGTAAAGVVDLGTGSDVALPSEPDNTMLGDGYLLAEDPGSGNLLLTDFHSGTAAAPVTVGTAYQGLGATAGTSWTVDPHTGWLAYEGAADRAIHVIDPGVPHSPITGLVTGPTWESTYTGQVSLSQPISHWQVVVTRQSGGQQVAVLNGGSAHASLSFFWNGRRTNGQLAYNGDYTATLYVVGLGGSAYQRVVSTTFTLYPSASDRHIYNMGNHPDLLAMKSASGGSTWWTRSNSGGIVRDPHSTCQQATAQIDLPLRTVIPITQQWNPSADDLLVIDAYGRLRLFPAMNGQYGECPETAAAVLVGSGWDAYTSVTSPGDMNRDGHDDLVARDKAGVLWFYAGLGKGHFRPRVRLGGGWNSYTHLIGAGDLNGDGNGDLLAVDAAGNLYRFSGNGRGGFASAVRIGSGFNAYRDIVSVGDWNGDGTYDLIARDRAGYLWLYDGTGTGGFHARTRIAGFGSYWAIF